MGPREFAETELPAFLCHLEAHAVVHRDPDAPEPLSADEVADLKAELLAG